jgi:hypothetical protein
MEFPISRHELQNYYKRDMRNETIKQAINARTDEICKRVEHTVKFSYWAMICACPINRMNFIVPNNRNDEATDILDDVLHNLHKRFPDSKIKLSQNKDYVLIDWSEDQFHDAM